MYSGNLPEGIDCQRCHGPAQRHVDLASTPGAIPAAIRAAVVNPARLDNDRQLEVCAQCHLKTTEFLLPHAIKRYERPDFSYKPGEPRASFALAFDEAPGPNKNIRFETASAVSRMRASQCFLESNGALKCTTCHDPHDVRHGSEAMEHYNSVCRQCHAVVTKAGHPSQTGCIAFSRITARLTATSRTCWPGSRISERQVMSSVWPCDSAPPMSPPA